MNQEIMLVMKVAEFCFRKELEQSRSKRPGQDWSCNQIVIYLLGQAKVTYTLKSKLFFIHLVLKFIYSEKATKFCKISTIDLTGTT